MIKLVPSFKLRIKHLYWLSKEGTNFSLSILGVDYAFRQLMEDIFGKDVMEAFQKKRPAGYVDLMIAFESRKRGCSPNKLTPLNIALPFSFIDFYKRQKGKDVSKRRFTDFAMNFWWAKENLRCLENKWAVTFPFEKLISFNSVSRGWVNVTILIYFTSSYPLEL